MLPAITAANKQLDIYGAGKSFTQILKGYQTWGIYAGLTITDSTLEITLRGSTDVLDFVRDARLAMVDRGRIGMVDDGFYQGIPKLYRDIKPLMEGRRVYLDGHSLGAAHAGLLSGEMVLDQQAVSGVWTFGCPRPAGARLREIIQDAKVPFGGFENFLDPVVNVPFGEHPYTPEQAIKIQVAPTALMILEWGPVAPHHMQLYAEGAAKS